jgi:hypothetical protein
MVISKPKIGKTAWLEMKLKFPHFCSLECQLVRIDCDPAGG